MMRSLFLLLLIPFCDGTTWAENVDIYKMSTEKSCPEDKRRVEDLTALPDKDFPILDQKSTGTCYGHASYRLVNSLYNKVNHTDIQLSLVDLIGQGCQREYVDAGHPTSALHLLRNKEARVLDPAKGEPNIEDVMKMDWKIRRQDVSNCESLLPILSPVLDAVPGKFGK